MGRGQETARPLKTYTINFTKIALNGLKTIPKEDQRKIRDKIDGLAKNPRPPGIKGLKGGLKGYDRLRVGNYRVIYEIQEEQITILVLSIGDRKQVYR